MGSRRPSTWTCNGLLGEVPHTRSRSHRRLRSSSVTEYDVLIEPDISYANNKRPSVSFQEGLGAARITVTSLYMRRVAIISVACVAVFSAVGTPCFAFPQSPNTQSSTAPQSVTNVAADMDEVVGAYRKIIVLMDGASVLDEGNRERVRTVAWILFERNRDRLEKLEKDLRTSMARNDSKPIEEFLQRLETNAGYRDADKLAFRDLVDGLAAQTQQGNRAPLRAEARHRRSCGP